MDRAGRELPDLIADRRAALAGRAGSSRGGCPTEIASDSRPHPDRRAKYS
jgi:hypothetical protein